MPGLRQPLSAHIQQIRNDLRERYKGGFPILKELLQNADDAGAGTPGASASELVMLLANGVPNSRHVLLQAPGLCLVNDGDFTSGDAISISSYGSSNRGSQSATVGRFGLGLKSIFHWAEAFFYFSPASFSNQVDGCPPFDLLHPWISRETGQGFHKDWDQQWAESKDHDHNQFEALARSLLQSGRWFGIWIPFRAKHLLNGVEPVLPEWPLGSNRDEASFDSLFGADWDKRVGEVLPLLRRLRKIRFCSQVGDRLKEVLTLSIDGSCQRMRFLAGNGHDSQSGPVGLDGKILVQSSTEASEAVSFAGIEKIPATVNAGEWQDHKFWPRSFVQTDNGGEEARPEKAAEHGAVTIVRQPATIGEVRIQPAVFLPLGEPEKRPINSSINYTIFLHGHFFVDSGRRDIEKFEGMAAEIDFAAVNSEEDLRKLWNRTLMQDVVAPLVLPSLEAFVNREQMAFEDVELLVEALEKSKTLKPLTRWMCRGQRFIPRLLKTGSAWERQTWSDEPPRWIELPAPDFSEAKLFGLMPALMDLSKQVGISLEGKAHLVESTQNPSSPSEEELETLLGSVSASAFFDPQQLAYLLKLVSQGANSRKPDSPLIAVLIRLANRLLTERLPEDKELAKGWRDFFKHIPAAAFIRLPVPSTEVSAEVAVALLDGNAPVAFLWQDFLDAEGNGSIPWPNLLRLVQQLGNLTFTSSEPKLQRSNVAVHLLNHCFDKPAGWLDLIRELPLFASHAPNAELNSVAVVQMHAAWQAQHLFTGGDSWATDLVKAVPAVKLLLVEPDIAKAVELRATYCDAAASIKLIHTAPDLAGDFVRRKPLFERLLAVTQSNVPDYWAALRCLLHGQPSAWENEAALFDETEATPILSQLIEKALTVAGQPWRRISAAVAGQVGLKTEHRGKLKLVPCSENHVEALLKEVGPSKLDCSDISEGNCDTILHHFSDVDVLRGLSIHDTLTGRRVRIDSQTYVNDAQFAGLPPEFDQLVTRLRPRNGYLRFANPDGSNRLVNALSWEAVIEVALSQPNPDMWASVILTAIGNRGNLRADLRGRVQMTAWLPRLNGLPIKPADLLHVPGTDPEIDKLPAEILNQRVPLLRLNDTVRNHSGFDTFKKTVLPGIPEAIDALATLVQTHAAWSTGLMGEWTPQQVGDWVSAMEGVPPEALPIAALVRAMHGEKNVRDLLPAFLRSISGKSSFPAYTEAITHLAGMHVNRDADSRRCVNRVFLAYLRCLNTEGVETARQVLSGEGVRLLSVAGAWKHPSQLAFACNGLPAEAWLCDEQAETLSVLRPPENTLVAEPDEPTGHPAHHFDSLLRETPRVLRQYFSQWRDQVPVELIGAFLAVLGDDEGMARLASEFLGNRSLAGIRQDIDTHSNPQLGQPLRVQVGQYRFACVSYGSRRVRLLSIIGTRFSTSLVGQVRTLFLGDGLVAYQGAGNWYLRTLHLAPIPTGQFTPDRLGEILLNSTTEILYNVYCLREIRLAPLWKILSHSAQLHIRIAQNRVVDAAQAFLRQVGAHRTPEVQSTLRDWDAADRRRAEAEEAGREVPREIQQQLAGAKDRLRGLLKGHPQTQQATLMAVRHKIGRDYGYESISVPFETWQNADDAVVELEVLGYDSDRAKKLGFVVETDSGSIRFVHWGRLVNEFQSADGRQFRNRGFDEDLEKMVVQAISDKRVGGQPGEAVTGKFGLGFKSVFLVADRPEVLSGGVDFTIRGGIYPVRMDETQRLPLEKSLKELAPDHWRRGTVIGLPLRTDANLDVGKVLGLFCRLAPFLVIFSRRLKRLRFRTPDGQDTEVRWEPTIIEKIEGVECGTLSTYENGSVRRALVLSRSVDGDHLQILLGLDADGFVPLPSETPVFWVTAPTRATPGYGFAVNGPFEPDVGRVQLAMESEKNRELSGELAVALNSRLAALFATASAGWEALRNQLELASGTTVQVFWEGVWQVLGRRFAAKWRKDDGSPVATLARRILWESSADGMQAFYRDSAALPTGLPGDYRTLVKLPELQFVASGALDREDVFRVVSGWQTFRQRFPAGVICSQQEVALTLARLGVKLDNAELVNLTTAASWEIGERRLVDPDLATRLGNLLTPDFLCILSKTGPPDSIEQEEQTLSELLFQVQFHAADGSWHKAIHLTVSAGECVTLEEKSRAAFAPQECRLNDAYEGSALDFFLACRPRLEADVQTMSRWVLQARVQNLQVAALRYLLKGELKERLAEELRRQRDDSKWLWQLTEKAWFKTHFTSDEQHQIRAYILRLFDDALRQHTLTLPIPPIQPEPEPVQAWTVAELWKWWHEQGEPTGDYTLEGEANWDLFHGGALWGKDERKADLKRLLQLPSEPEGKSLWYRLFGYACLVSAERTMTELRRFWLRRLNAERFWERTSEGDFSQETHEIFDQAVTAEFTNMAAAGEQAYFWRRVFYDIRKVHRMVQSDFPAVLLELVNQGHGEHLRQFLRTGHLARPDQRPWVGTFGQSTDTPLGFIIRELVRLEVIQDKAVLPYAFYVCRPVLRALAKIGWIADIDSGFSGERWLTSLQTDPENGPKLLPYYDIPLLHMGITHRGDKMPRRPE